MSASGARRLRLHRRDRIRAAGARRPELLFRVARRHERRVDPPAHGHPGTPLRRGGRDDLRSRGERRRGGRSRPPGRLRSRSTSSWSRRSARTRRSPRRRCASSASSASARRRSTSTRRARASPTRSRRERRWSRPATPTRCCVIGAEVLSRFLDFTDRTVCILFGDGAGAVAAEALRRAGRDRRRPRRRRHDVGVAVHPGGWLPHAGVDGDRCGARPFDPDAARARGLPPRRHGDGRFLPRAAGEERASARRGGPARSPPGERADHERGRRAAERSPGRRRLRRGDGRQHLRGIDSRWRSIGPGEPGASLPAGLVLLTSFGAGLSWGATLVRWTAPSPTPLP